MTASYKVGLTQRPQGTQREAFASSCEKIKQGVDNGKNNPDSR